jgi:hypothetical protein
VVFTPSGRVCAAGTPRSSDRGQLRHPQTFQGPGVVGAAASLPRALHAYLLFLAQSSRALVGLITQRAIRRGSFSSVKELVQKIDAFVQHYNRTYRPFVWTATADSILQKIARLCSRI